MTKREDRMRQEIAVLRNEVKVKVHLIRQYENLIGRICTAARKLNAILWP